LLPCKTRSLWYPVWLGYAAALVPNSKLIDAPAAEITLSKLLSQIRSFELIVVYNSTQSLNNDIQVAEAIKKKYPAYFLLDNLLDTVIENLERDDKELEKEALLFTPSAKSNKFK